MGEKGRTPVQVEDRRFALLCRSCSCSCSQAGDKYGTLLRAARNKLLPGAVVLAIRDCIDGVVDFGIDRLASLRAQPKLQSHLHYGLHVANRDQNSLAI